MKRAIEKAIENGFNSVWDKNKITTKFVSFDGGLGEINIKWICKCADGQEIISPHTYDIFRLIFGTDFIDKLDPRVACGLYKSCVCIGKEIDGEFVSVCSASQTPGKECQHYGLSTMAYHHRREMANKSLEELKEYVRGLV